MSAGESDSVQIAGEDALGRRDGRAPSPAARRALAEAEARRAQPKPARPREINGRVGQDPIRYGDWEVKGLASDF